jgi:hypothetical protein
MSSPAPASWPSPACGARAQGQQLLGGGGTQSPVASVVAPVPRLSPVARPVLVSLDQVVFGPSPPGPPAHFSRSRSGEVFKWAWVRVGTLDPSLSFPAPLSDVESWRRRSRSNPIPRLLCKPSSSPPMDRSRGDPRVGSKRSFEDFDSYETRRNDRARRERLDQDALRRQRAREADRDWDRYRSPEWRRSEGRRSDEERRYEAGPSYVQEQISRKKVGVRKFSARSRAAAAAVTPTPPPPPQVAPPPSSAAHSSHLDLSPQGPKKAGIKCFNCSKDGHYQSG